MPTRPPCALAAAIASAAPAPEVAGSAVLLKPPMRDEDQAWRQLAALWKFDPADGSPCASATSASASPPQVQCFKGVGSLELLRQIGRPGILTLRDDRGQPSYALLMGLSSLGVRLRLDGGVTQTIPPAVLAERWRGEFSMFWRAPEGYRGALSQGQSGPAVEALARQLARVRGEPVPARASEFGPGLKAKVVAFQVGQGLQPDGVAGPTTFMQLNRALGVDEPRLPADAAAG